MGQSLQRDAFGDGYVDALRTAYPQVPDAADLVMYWWYKAAKEVAEGRTFRAGLITTQSITQQQNRQLVVDAEAKGARVAWAIADHYWNDGSKDARVRVAMTVIAKYPPAATLVTVDGNANVVATVVVPRLNADLSAHADVPATAAIPLTANAGLCSNGYKPHGGGFLVSGVEARSIIAADAKNGQVLRPYRNGMDLATHPRDVWIVDFAHMDEGEAKRYPVLYDIVRDRVKPERDANARAVYRTYWWRFGEPRRDLRSAVKGLSRYIATVAVAKHRFFTFLDSQIAPDNKLACITSADAFHLGVLSSSIHATWALAAGSRLGIDGTPSYDKGTCFDAFPFPEPSASQRHKIAHVAEGIDAHRKAGLARSNKVGMTILYNVVDRLRAGTALSKAEREVHELAACGTLRDFHDELDRLVAEAYGWAWPVTSAVILDQLVALHDRRVEEERAGEIRWLRPDYQKPRFGKQTQIDTDEPGPAPKTGPPSARATWPGDAIGQITALRALAFAAPITVDEATRHFAGAPRDFVLRHLETLAILGELHVAGDGHYAAVPAVT